MSGHTPGPWVAQPDPHSNPGEWVIGIANGPVDYVAVCSERDARLIAAAPDLLEALVALFNDYKRLADSGDAGFWSLEDLPEGKQALAAIAKATGGDA